MSKKITRTENSNLFGYSQLKLLSHFMTIHRVNGLAFISMNPDPESQ